MYLENIPYSSSQNQTDFPSGRLGSKGPNLSGGYLFIGVDDTMSKAQASMVKTIDLIQLDEYVHVYVTENDGYHCYYGEVHAIDAIGIAVYMPENGTTFFPWTMVDKVVL